MKPKGSNARKLVLTPLWQGKRRCKDKTRRLKKHYHAQLRQAGRREAEER